MKKILLISALCVLAFTESAGAKAVKLWKSVDADGSRGLAIKENSERKICPTGKVLSGEVCVSCETLMTNCDRCSTTTTCLSCKKGFVLRDGVCKKNGCETNADCLNIEYCDTISKKCERLECQRGTYLGTHQCLKCPTECTECTGPTECTACETNYSLEGSQCVTITCADGEYVDQNECHPCSGVLENCLACSTSKNCTRCEEGTVLEHGKCVVPKCKTDDDCADTQKCNKTTKTCEDLECEKEYEPGSHTCLPLEPEEEPECGENGDCSDDEVCVNPGKGDAACVQLECEEGQVAAGHTCIDGEGKTCPAGTYCKDDNCTSCLECPSGSYMKEDNHTNTSCTPCYEGINVGTGAPDYPNGSYCKSCTKTGTCTEAVCTGEYTANGGSCKKDCRLINVRMGYDVNTSERWYVNYGEGCPDGYTNQPPLASPATGPGDCTVCARYKTNGNSCTLDSQCEDNKFCDNGTCQIRTCSNLCYTVSNHNCRKENDECCAMDNECADNEVCSNNVCVEKTCLNACFTVSNHKCVKSGDDCCTTDQDCELEMGLGAACFKRITDETGKCTSKPTITCTFTDGTTCKNNTPNCQYCKQNNSTGCYTCSRYYDTPAGGCTSPRKETTISGVKFCCESGYTPGSTRGWQSHCLRSADESHALADYGDGRGCSCNEERNNDRDWRDEGVGHGSSCGYVNVGDLCIWDGNSAAVCAQKHCM